jgi:hypothetical protein
LLQYLCLFLSAGQPGNLKKVQASVTAARKVFRIMRVSQQHSTRVDMLLLLALPHQVCSCCGLQTRLSRAWPRGVLTCAAAAMALLCLLLLLPSPAGVCLSRSRLSP